MPESKKTKSVVVVCWDYKKLVLKQGLETFSLSFWVNNDSIKIEQLAKFLIL